MKVILASKKFINNDVDYNLKVILETMDEARNLGAELVCFGEAFLQGFDALCWTDYVRDLEVAVSIDSDIMETIKEKSIEFSVAVAFGYIEKENDSMYSSYIIIDQGKVITNYRRISEGWKEYSKTDEHYCEGDITDAFSWKGRSWKLCLCGDLFVFPEKFHVVDEILLWPIYMQFSIEAWEESFSEEYRELIKSVGNNALIINSLSDNPEAFGGSYYYHNGEFIASLAMGKEGILLVELENNY
jgi:Predicted amidohydrolase